MAKFTINETHYQCDTCSRTSRDHADLGFVELVIKALRIIGEGSPRAQYAEPNKVHICDDCFGRYAVSIRTHNIADEKSDLKLIPKRGDYKWDPNNKPGRKSPRPHINNRRSKNTSKREKSSDDEMPIASDVDKIRELSNGKKPRARKAKEPKSSTSTPLEVRPQLTPTEAIQAAAREERKQLDRIRNNLLSS